MKVSYASMLSGLICCAGLLLCASCTSQQDSKPAAQVHSAPSPIMQEEPTTELYGPADELMVEDAAEAPLEETEMEVAAPLDPASTEAAGQNGKPDFEYKTSSAAQPAAAPLTTSVPQGYRGDARAVLESANQLEQSRSSEVAGSLSPVSSSGGAKKFPEDPLTGEENDRPQTEPSNREAYDAIVESPFKQVSDHPLSTFSIDVDTASYSNMRRFLSRGQFPPAGAVRIEELVNYFTYDYPQPKGEDPFAADVEIAAAPWNEKHRLVRIGIQGRKIEADQRPACNLVFLIDTSGSMQDANKLPLVAQSMLMLAETLNERDRVAIVTYAGSAGVLLPATAGSERETINHAINSMRSGGSTNGAGGIRMAYEIARQNFNKESVNRVILATDGDFNVGVTNQSELTSLIEEEAKSGVFLSVLGYGMGNYNDSTLEKLADKGNGNYAYIDTINESRKVLGEQVLSTLITIAKDVKIQIEFNPAHVAAYRLIGYENRIMQKEDFNDDKKDAGEIGAGHTVTALYEIVPVGEEVPTAGVDPLKYQKNEPQLEGKLSDAAKTDELLTLKLRYKAPDGEKSKLIEIPVKDQDRKFAEASKDFQFAASVASFGMTLRKSKHNGAISLDGILEIARSTTGDDPSGYRAEFVQLVQRAKEMHR